jgi:gluconolactonase
MISAPIKLSILSLSTLAILACSDTSEVSAGSQTHPSMASEICPNTVKETRPKLSNLEVKLLKEGFKGAEGIVWVESQQVLYFSEMYRNKDAEGIGWQDSRSANIIKFDPESKETQVWYPNSGTNGLALSPDGKSLFGAAHDKREIARFALDSKVRSSYAHLYQDGTRFNSPNDITIRSDGHIYFSDPNWQQDGANGGNPPLNSLFVTWLKPNGTATIIDSTLIQPNGISLSPDEKTLYVTHIDGAPANKGRWDRTGKLFAYTVNADGSVSNKREFGLTDTTADGMVVDCAGNLYVTQLGKVDVYAPDGERLGSIKVKTNQFQASNVAFGGPENKTLFITVEQASGDHASRVYSIHSVELNIPGLPY